MEPQVKVGDNLAELWPYRDPPFPSAIDPDSVTDPLLHRAITKHAELLGNYDLNDNQKQQVLENLIGYVSNEDKKMKVISEDEGVMIDHVATFLCYDVPTIRARAARVLSELVMIPQGQDRVAQNGFALPSLADLLLSGDTQDHVNGVDAECAEGHKWAARVFRNMCTSPNGCALLAAPQTEGDATSLLPLLINAGLRGGKGVEESVEDILFTLTALAKSSSDSCEQLLHERVVPAALQFLPPASTDEEYRKAVQTLTAFANHSITANALQLLSAIATHPIGQEHLIDHHALSPIVAYIEAICKLIKLGAKEVKEVQMIVVACGIVALMAATVEGKSEIVSHDRFWEAVIELFGLVKEHKLSPIHATLMQAQLHVISALKGCCEHPPSRVIVKNHLQDYPDVLGMI